MVVGINCLGVNCEYFRKVYDTQPISTKTRKPKVYVPVFDVSYEYCSHPSVYIPTVDSFKNCEVGKRLQSIKQCPKKLWQEKGHIS